MIPRQRSSSTKSSDIFALVYVLSVTKSKPLVNSAMVNVERLRWLSLLSSCNLNSCYGLSRTTGSVVLCYICS